MQNITRDNHYIPQAVPHQWSNDGERVHAYRILVSHSEVPEWELRSISGTAYHRDLYTSFTGDEELDEFEQWIEKEFEIPGLEAINKLVLERRLSQMEWRAIALFVAAQDVRTPLNFIESMRRWNQEVPGILENSIKETVRKLEDAREQGIRLIPSKSKNEFSELFRVHIKPPSEKDSDEASIQAEVVIGRRFWIASMRHLLSDAAKTLCQHRWSVARPHADNEWPLTDHPVLRLNYYRPGKYDFRGGWGNEGSEIIMPVSPRHVLYVQVGKKIKSRFVFSSTDTELVQRLIVERAHRWVFAREPIDGVTQVKPRIVDRKIFTDEAIAWKRLHEDQTKAEGKKRGQATF